MTDESKSCEVISVTQLARMLKRHPQSIRRLVRDGSLPKQRKIGRMHPYWLASDLADVIGDQSNKAA
jgi:predicted DNA-binding transcriptional regulator AlpA